MTLPPQHRDTPNPHPLDSYAVAQLEAIKKENQRLEAENAAVLKEIDPPPSPSPLLILPDRRRIPT